MKKSALAFISALLMAAAFVSCSDSSSSGSSGAGSENSAADDGGRSYVTAWAEEDGIHFSIEVPALFDKAGGAGYIGIRRTDKETGLAIEAGVNTEEKAEIVYPLVKAGGETYTFNIGIEPKDKSRLDWREHYLYGEDVTVIAAGGLGDVKITASGSKQPVIKGYEENFCYDSEGEESGRVFVYFNDPDITFEWPAGIEEPNNEAAVCVGDEDHWDSYTQWIWCWNEWNDDNDDDWWDGYSCPGDYNSYKKILAYANKHDCNTVMVQRRWRFSVPGSKGIGEWLITSMSESANVDEMKELTPQDPDSVWIVTMFKDGLYMIFFNNNGSVKVGEEERKGYYGIVMEGTYTGSLGKNGSVTITFTEKKTEEIEIPINEPIAGTISGKVLRFNGVEYIRQ